MLNRILDIIALCLVIIAGINLAIVGIFDYDPLIDLSGDFLLIARILFFMMGVAAIYLCIRLKDLIQTLQPPT